MQGVLGLLMALSPRGIRGHICSRFQWAIKAISGSSHLLVAVSKRVCCAAGISHKERLAQICSNMDTAFTVVHGRQKRLSSGQEWIQSPGWTAPLPFSTKNSHMPVLGLRN